MNVDEIRSILDLVRENDLTEFELEVEGIKIKVRKQGAQQVVHIPGPAGYAPLPAVAMAPHAPAAVPAPRAEVRPAASTEPAGHAASASSGRS